MSSSSSSNLLIRLFVILFFVGIVLGVPFMKCFVGFAANYSEGFRNGEIVKASTKGIFFITNELQLQIGTSGENLHHFSCPDDDLWNEIQAAAENSNKVRIEYRQWLLMPYSVGDSLEGYEVTGIKVLE